MSTELQEVKNNIANISADVRTLTNSQNEMMISFKEYLTRQEISLQAQEKTQAEVKELSNRVGTLEIEGGKAGTERKLGKYILGAVFTAIIGIYLVQKPGSDDQKEILQIMKQNYGTSVENFELKRRIEEMEHE